MERRDSASGGYSDLERSAAHGAGFDAMLIKSSRVGAISTVELARHLSFVSSADVRFITFEIRCRGSPLVVAVRRTLRIFDDLRLLQPHLQLITNDA